MRHGGPTGHYRKYMQGLSSFTKHVEKRRLKIISCSSEDSELLTKRLNCDLQRLLLSFIDLISGKKAHSRSLCLYLGLLFEHTTSLLPTDSLSCSSSSNNFGTALECCLPPTLPLCEGEHGLTQLHLG